jgi:hypothetical protein
MRRVVLARVARNRRLADAFTALSASPGARAYYEPDGLVEPHHQALRAPANRLVGVLHGCLKNRQLYGEDVAWPTALEAVA